VPELPETETLARDLDRVLAGRRVQAVSVRRADVLRGVTARALMRRVAGARILRVWRRAKAVVMDLGNEDRLVFTPRFTGGLLVGREGESIRDAFIATEFSLADGGSFAYRDVRRLGTVSCLDSRAFARFDRGLGIEPLDSAFTTDRLSGFLRLSRQAVKKILMDQRRLAGVGNIYANEALWLAGVDPSRTGSRVPPLAVATLRDAVVRVLTDAIEARGTTFRDFRDAWGEPGTFASRLAVYGRAGLPCRRCGSRLAATHAIDGRSTVFCFRCQR
jgi:formamidopyrimidine-DNA glycosylase